MPRRAILEFPDPVLRQRAEPVERFDGELAGLVTDLLDTLAATGGIGLCAPQLGELRRVLVVDLSGTASEPQVFVNPVIEAHDVMALVEESCLSVPGVVGNVIRATQLRVRAQDTQGTTFVRDLDGMAAVCLQHELDHLEGKLFVDRLSLFARLRFRARAFAKARRGAAA